MKETETERRGVDIGVALSSKATMLKAASSSNTSDVPPTAPNIPTVSDLASVEASFKSALKKRVRPLFRTLYGMLRPLVRPIAFRLRAYMSAPLEARMRHLHQAQQLLDERSQFLARDSAAHTLQVLQEIKSSRDSARRHIASVANESSRMAATIADEAFRLDRMEDQLASRLDRMEDQLASRLDRIEDQLASRVERMEDQLARIEGFGQTVARRVTVSCGPDAVMIRTNVGYVLCGASDHAVIAILTEVGDLERGTRLLIERVLQPSACFIDVGANVGMHTIAAGRALGGQGRIIAFEPYPATHELLCRTIWINGFSDLVQTYQAAVSNHAGSRFLHLGATSGHHSLHILEQASAPTPPPVKVQTLRLDDVLAAGTSVDLLKIDVEGAELEVLEGAQRTITENPHAAIIAEFGISHLRRTGHSTTEWLARFASLGLDFKAIHPDSGALMDWSTADLEKVLSVNLFFARPNAPVWARAGGAA